jgi:hypothetical protein
MEQMAGQRSNAELASEASGQCGDSINARA